MLTIQIASKLIRKHKGCIEAEKVAANEVATAHTEKDAKRAQFWTKIRTLIAQTAAEEKAALEAKAAKKTNGGFGARWDKAIENGNFKSLAKMSNLLVGSVGKERFIAKPNEKNGFEMLVHDAAKVAGYPKLTAFFKTVEMKAAAQKIDETKPKAERKPKAAKAAKAAKASK